ncbi:sulfite exporter TauE/SafE family protein [Bailinhaonella thermotolerans]|uniref:Probable membrane transporter protein n=1 Tax=Bailinhaonella thermotolerans TaxID=1070861 RepID=A0A3A4AVF9_9ACTN|nr:sulfite exporter TauE/SafE family protein [Bailinhaonella thermotolerans]RJL34220.1 sulfite exporter TauE/SafE family protein [Bailinhaonella thermotolerans]
MSPTALLVVIGVAVFLGAVVQGAVGFGIGLVGTPVAALLDPGLMPGAMLIVAAAMPVFSVAREWRHVDLRGLGWALLGRVPGTAAGVWIVTVVSQRALGAIVGVMVLAATALTARTVSVPRNRVTLTLAGLVSGVTATAAAIGGPPIALVYQRARGPQIRATLGAFFLAGGLFSLASLAAAGSLPGRAVFAGLVLIPCVVAGFIVADPVRRFLDGGRIRAAVLVVAAVSALFLIVRSLV